jgi:hypothetical protein
MDKRRNTTPAGRIAEKHSSRQSSSGDELYPPEATTETRKQRGRTDILKKEMFEIMSGIGFHEVVQGYFEKPGIIPYDSIPRSRNASVAEYTLNPNVEAPPLKKNTIFVLDGDYFSRNGLVGKRVSEVLQHIVDNFSHKNTFPDVRFSVWYEDHVNDGDTDYNMGGIGGPTYVLVGSRYLYSNGEVGVAAYNVNSGALEHSIVHLDQAWETGMWVVMLKQKD